MISLRRAIVESCDIYFYQAGLKIGVDTIAHYAKEFGLGKKDGDFPSPRKIGDRSFVLLEKEEASGFPGTAERPSLSPSVRDI